MSSEHIDNLNAALNQVKQARQTLVKDGAADLQYVQWAIDSLTSQLDAARRANAKANKHEENGQKGKKYNCLEHCPEKEGFVSKHFTYLTRSECRALIFDFLLKDRDKYDEFVAKELRDLPNGKQRSYDDIQRKLNECHREFQELMNKLPDGQYREDVTYMLHAICDGAKYSASSEANGSAKDLHILLHLKDKLPLSNIESYFNPAERQDLRYKKDSKGKWNLKGYEKDEYGLPKIDYSDSPYIPFSENFWNCIKFPNCLLTIILIIIGIVLILNPEVLLQIIFFPIAVIIAIPIVLKLITGKL